MPALYDDFSRIIIFAVLLFLILFSLLLPILCFAADIIAAALFAKMPDFELPPPYGLLMVTVTADAMPADMPCLRHYARRAAMRARFADGASVREFTMSLCIIAAPPLMLFVAFTRCHHNRYAVTPATIAFAAFRYIFCCFDIIAAFLLSPAIRADAFIIITPLLTLPILLMRYSVAGF